MENIRTLPDGELQKRILEAQRVAPLADISEHYLMHELARRQSLIGIRALVESCYDASQDNYKNPSEAPQAWAVESENPNIIRGRE